MNKQQKNPQILPLCYIDESVYTISHQDAEIAHCDNEIAQFEVDWVCVRGLLGAALVVQSNSSILLL